MATNRDLLKEAIADAKAVKETAIANAKLALEEAFTPHLKSMLAAKLDEMDKKDDEVKEAKEDDEKIDEMDAPSFRRKNSPSYNSDPDGGPVNPIPHKVGKSTVQEDEIDEEINLDELLAELDEAKDDLSDADKKSIDREADAIRDDADQISKLAKDAGEDAEDIKDKVSDDRAIDAVRDDLDQISKLAKDAGEDAKDVKVSEELNEDEKTRAEEEGYLDGMDDEKKDEEDRDKDEEIDLEDMSEDDLKDFIEDVIKDMVAGGEIEPGDEFVEDEVEVEDEIDIEDVEDVDVDVEIDEMKKPKDEVDEAMEKKDEVDEGYSNKDGDKDDSPTEKKSEKGRFGVSEEVAEELAAALASVNELKAELNEVNLLNAKLLYTNKIFKAKNLTESKKVKVLKAFDKATNVKQAKTIYETLNEGLGSKTINESINKGSASKATGVEPKAKHPIVESNDIYNRMRKLAGLI